jgi:hypothetical protein
VTHSIGPSSTLSYRLKSVSQELVAVSIAALQLEERQQQLPEYLPVRHVSKDRIQPKRYQALGRFLILPDLRALFGSKRNLCTTLEPAEEELTIQRVENSHHACQWVFLQGV